MDNVKIQEQMESWFTYFDEIQREYKKIHITEKTGDGLNEKIKQKDGAGKS